MTFTKTGPQLAHAPQAEGEGTSALTESRMRQSLERLGGRSTPTGHGTHVLASRPRRHAFVRDGEVPVEQARRRSRADAPMREEPQLQPQPGGDPQARVTAAERQAREAREQARLLATRLGHAELRLHEATTRADAAEARAVEAESALAETRTRLAALEAELEHWKATARLAAEGDDVAAPDAGQEPVQWWVSAAAGG